MIRRLFIVCMGVFAVTTATLWAVGTRGGIGVRRSQFRAAAPGQSAGANMFSAAVRHGAIIVDFACLPYDPCPDGAPSDGRWRLHFYDERQTLFQRLVERTNCSSPPAEFHWLPEYHRVGNPYTSVTVVTVPLYLPLVASAAYPLIAFIRGPLRRRRRRLRGLCLACGYDLTGNTSGICPECGGVICSVE